MMLLTWYELQSLWSKDSIDSILWKAKFTLSREKEHRLKYWFDGSRL